MNHRMAMIVLGLVFLIPLPVLAQTDASTADLSEARFEARFEAFDWLIGEWQGFLGLPTVSVAIEPRTTLECWDGGDSAYELHFAANSRDQSVEESQTEPPEVLLANLVEAASDRNLGADRDFVFRPGSGPDAAPFGAELTPRTNVLFAAAVLHTGGRFGSLT